MLKTFGLSALIVLTLVGCGAAPTAPTAAGPEPQEQEAFLADKFTGELFYYSRDQRSYMRLSAKSVTGRTMTKDMIHFSVDGETVVLSKLIMGADGALYMSRPTKEPRVNTYHKVGTYDVKKPANGQAVTFKLNGKLKATSSNLPMVGHETITLKADALPSATAKEPAWLALKGQN